MAVHTDLLREVLIKSTTENNSEWGYGRVPFLSPEFIDGSSSTSMALAVAFKDFLKIFPYRYNVDVIDTLKGYIKEHGVEEDSTMLSDFFGVDFGKFPTSEKCLCPEDQITTAVDLFIGFSIWKTLNESRRYHDDADLLVQLGANINSHLSALHFRDNLGSSNFSKSVYNFMVQDESRAALFHKELGNRLTSLGIDPLIGNVRIYYNEKSRMLHWSSYQENGGGEYRVSYNPNGNHFVWALCGIDGSGKTTLLNGLERVVLPIAHPNDDRMMTFFAQYSDILDYAEELATFNAQRRSVLREDLAIASFRFIRNLFAFIQNKYGVFTIFQNTIMDRSSLTNIAYVNSPFKFCEAVDEFTRDFFLHPNKIVVIDTPVSIAYARATKGREGEGEPDEFDNAEFTEFIRRATLYRILANVLPNVIAVNTYDAERDSVYSPAILVENIKQLLYPKV